MRVLIAVSDQQTGLELADFVINHQWSADTVFRLVAVVEYDLVGGVPADLLESLRAERLKESWAVLKQISTRLNSAASKLSTEEMIVNGSPGAMIIEAAKEWQADLIIIGSHGRSPIARIILGSVCQFVLTASPCNVLVIKMAAKKDKNR